MFVPVSFDFFVVVVVVFLCYGFRSVRPMTTAMNVDDDATIDKRAAAVQSSIELLTLSFYARARRKLVEVHAPELLNYSVDVILEHGLVLENDDCRQSVSVLISSLTCC